MTLYDYLCKTAAESFTLTMPTSEHDKRRVQYLRRNGAKVEQQVRSLFTKTSRKG